MFPPIGHVIRLPTGNPTLFKFDSAGLQAHRLTLLFLRGSVTPQVNRLTNDGLPLAIGLCDLVGAAHLAEGHPADDEDDNAGASAVLAGGLVLVPVAIPGTAEDQRFTRECLSSAILTLSGNVSGETSTLSCRSLADVLIFQNVFNKLIKLSDGCGSLHIVYIHSVVYIFYRHCRLPDRVCSWITHQPILSAFPSVTPEPASIAEPPMYEESCPPQEVCSVFH